MMRIAARAHPKPGAGVVPRRESILHPRHPERVCWGCNLYCPADEMRCGNGTIRTPHPIELLGPDWDGQPGASPPEKPADATPAVD